MEDLLLFQPFGVAIAGSHRLVGLETTHSFLTVLEAREVQGQVAAGLVSGEDLAPDSQTLLTVSSHAERVTELSRVSFIKALIPFMRAPPL